MRVCLEATSLVGRRTGVGHTTAELAGALVAADPDVQVALLGITLRGAGRLKRVAPVHPRIEVVRSRLPARGSSWVWSHTGWPPAELFCGAADVFHGPNFVLPPLLKAAGVLTIHDIGFVHHPDTASTHTAGYAATVPVSAGRAARIIVPSTFTATELAGWLPDVAGRIRVVPMAVREVFLRRGGPLNDLRRAELGLRAPYCLHVGTLERRKNVDVLLAAFRAVLSKDPGTQLVLAGAPGVGWDEIAATHEALLASGDVVVTGYLPDEEVAALVRGAGAFVYPSRYEGFGLPPLEALACGVPVVASDASSLPETLGPHARYVRAGDSDELAVAIADELSRPNDPDAAAQRRAWASAFTWARTARQTLRVYREAVREVAA